MSVPEPAEREADPSQKRYAWRVLGLNVVVVSQPALSAGMLNLALPDIARRTGAGPAQLTLVVSVYWLVSTVLLVSFGRLADMLGRRRLYMAGIAVFTLASAGCAAATSAEVLIGMRIGQAVGAAAIIVNSSALLTDAFPASLLSTGMGVSSSIFSAFGWAEPVVGGALVSGFGGQAVFWFDVPFGVVGLVGAVLLLRPHRASTGRQPFDVPGAAVSAAALTALVAAASAGNSWGWASPRIVGLLALSMGAFVVFALIERRRTHPLLDLHLFAAWSRSAAYLSLALLAVSDFSIALLMSLYFQRVMRLTALRAGLRLLPITLAAMVTAPVAGRLASRYSRQILSSSGLALHAVALLCLAGAFAGRPSYLVSSGCLAAIGVGTALFMTPNNHAIMSSVPADRRGTANAVRSTIQNVGGLTGTALVLAIVAGPAVATTPYRTAAMVLFALCAAGTVVSLARGRQRRQPGPRR